MLTERLTFGSVVVMGTLLALTMVIFRVVLPMQGVHDYADISNPAKFLTAQYTICLLQWIHVFYGVAWAGLAWGMFATVRRRLSLVLRYGVATILLSSVIIFLMHDYGFQIYQWAIVVQDPQDHAFGMDMLLLNIRNGILFVVGMLTVIDQWRAAPSVNLP